MAHAMSPAELLAKDKLDLGDSASRVQKFALAIGAVAFVVALVLAVNLFLGEDADTTLAMKRVYASFLTNVIFVLSFSLGALIFVLIQHVTRAGWSVVVRRIAEIIGSAMWVPLVLFVMMLLLGGLELYKWYTPAYPDALLEHKAPLLNPAIFLMLAVGGLVLLWILARLYLKTSVAQDESGEPALTRRMEKLSGAMIVVFAVLVTLFSVLAVMSLFPIWYSTIFGVYYFAGCMVGFFSLAILTLAFLQKSGRLKHTVTVEHYHDLGKFLFAFVVFWAYIGFSQYMLIWYANIPEEITWYLARGASTGGGNAEYYAAADLAKAAGDSETYKKAHLVKPNNVNFTWVSLLLLFGHFILPFFLLISRQVKRNAVLLSSVAGYMLVMHWFDMLWLVKPATLYGVDYPRGELPAAIDGLDIALLISFVGFFIAGIVGAMHRINLIPTRDPRLKESLAFHNI